MALHSSFGPTRASLVYQNTLSNLDSTINKLILEETCHFAIRTHYKYYLSIFSSTIISPTLLDIQTTDSSFMKISHLGHASLPNLSLSYTFLILKFTLNLLSVGQLCDLGVNVLFIISVYYVQDSQIGQTFGIRCEVECLFELISLYLPEDTSPF
ncbi:hypothetical protein CUMW_260780 [Citrus unshiu]|uniref:Uncharacterized protein n=2 Tax=Citrus TaxID=2706 RepID=A0A067DGH4_CITSI|nr:hypothetical protein CISIN_1g042127mg [Citrus sinensis]GAY68007.1 hypothetical protein CUMW_260780 [Citrus unshiu]